ncbi:MAG: glutamate synthase subunit beta [Marinilabiliales bacterium]|nr:MAG: glutamate synthase subunit beta [Marinilabiliales bacterium]
MGDPRGFIKVARKEGGNRPVHERLNDFSEVEQTLNETDRKLQASRCMDCGVPFCQWACPVINSMPEWQDAIYRGDWKAASDILHTTNNFPEFTGRVCPAPCEKSCVLAIHEEPVTIRENEAAVAEKAFKNGYITARPPENRTGKRVAVIGSGPAGLACADILNRDGHLVTLFEKDDEPGGLLRYGIPDFKLGKNIVDRRLDLMKEEGVLFRTSVDAGKDISAGELLRSFDAICLATGAMQPRDLDIDGRKLEGIHFAMDYLTSQNRIVAGTPPGKDEISAKGKDVLVIGGGDTGSDCVGTANRQGANSVIQLEIMPEPPLRRRMENPWPYWPDTLRSSSSHEEGCERLWGVKTIRFKGNDGKVEKAEISNVKWIRSDNGKMEIREIPGSRREIKAGLVLLALGFLHPVHDGLVTDLGLGLDEKGNILIDSNYNTTNEKVFASGDSASGASLVVTAIISGRRAANSISAYLTGD